MIKRIIVPLFMLLVGYTATAQSGTASPYSFYGIGSIKFKGTMENRDMGGISLYSDSLAVNVLNPASLGKLNLTTYSLGATFSRHNLKSEVAEDVAKSASFDYLVLGFPVSENLGVSFGLLPYSSVGYSLRNENDNGEESVYNQYEGEGGLTKVFLAFGYDISANLSVGVTANYDFGTIENMYINSRSGVELATRQQDRSELSGLDFKLALNYQRKVGTDHKLYSSLMYVPEAKISSNNYREYATIMLLTSGAQSVREEYVADLGALGSTEVTLPATTTFGLGYGKDKKWFVGAEYEFTQTSRMDNPFVVINGLEYQDASSVSVGGFIVPDYNSFNNYFKRCTYRLGGYYKQTGMVLNNEAVNDFGMSFGIGFPVAKISKINLGLDFGRRGTTNSGLIQENYFNFRLGLSLLDRWFIKRKFN